MDWLWSVLACVFILIGLIGSVLPVLPGPPISYLGMVILQFKETSAFTTRFLLIWLLIVIIITGIDYLLPVYGTKRLGGSTYGIWGCAVGLLIGIWFGLPGIIIGPFIGAFAGELLGRGEWTHAFRAALGSFIGFVLSTLLKLMACVVMGWYVVMALLQ
jgi:uncharacterized protein